MTEPLPFAADDVVSVDVLLMIDGTDVPTLLGTFPVHVLRALDAEQSAAAGLGASADGPGAEQAPPVDGAIAINPNEVVAGLVQIARGLRRQGQESGS